MKPSDLTTIEDGWTYPFVEDENCNITGYGHQDKALFAEVVRLWEEYMNGGSLSEGDLYTEDDIAHTWVYADDDGERMYPCSPEHVGAFPVTTIWGTR